VIRSMVWSTVIRGAQFDRNIFHVGYLEPCGVVLSSPNIYEPR
jgi:hypothetical protein